LSAALRSNFQHIFKPGGSAPHPKCRPYNRNVAGRTVRRVLGYNGNGAHFRRTTDEVARGGYQEFAFR